MAKQPKIHFESPSKAKMPPTLKVSNFEDQPQTGASTRPFIDIESLERLVDCENSGQNICDYENFHTVDKFGQGNRYGPPSAIQSFSSSSPTDSQLITFYSSPSNSTLRSFSFKEIFTSGRNLYELLSRHSENSTWWMDIQNPSENSLRLLCSAFHVHPLTVEDIWMQETHEKMEHFPSYYFTCMKSFRSSEAGTKPSYESYTIYMIVFEEGTLTLSFSRNEHSSHVLNRIAVLQDFISIKRNWIFYAFMDDIVDSFAVPISQIDKRVNDIDDQIYTTRIEDMRAFMVQIEAVRQNISSLTRLLSFKPNILKGFNKHHNELASHVEDPPAVEDISLYIGDIKDHVVTMMSNLKHFEALLSRAEKNCLAQLEINNDNGRRRVVKFMGRVTLITVILSVLNVICGLFSTNVNANTTLYATPSLTAWAIIVSLEGVLALALFYLAKRCRFF